MVSLFYQAVKLAVHFHARIRAPAYSDKKKHNTLRSPCCAHVAFLQDWLLILRSISKRMKAMLRELPNCVGVLKQWLGSREEKSE